MTDTCLFCSIIKKEKPAYVIYEDDAIMAMLDIFPHAPAHTLVIPKQHIETLLEMKPEDMQSFWTGVNNTLELLQKFIKSEGFIPLEVDRSKSVKPTPLAVRPLTGFTIGINHGKVSGQAVEHLHIHILPRYEGDGGGSMHSVTNNPGLQSVEEMYKSIKRIANSD